MPDLRPQLGRCHRRKPIYAYKRRKPIYAYKLCGGCQVASFESGTNLVAILALHWQWRKSVVVPDRAESAKSQCSEKIR